MNENRISDSWQMTLALRAMGYWNQEHTCNMKEDWSCIRVMETGETYWFTYRGETLPPERNPLLQ